MIRPIASLLCLLFIAEGHTATVFRCVDSSGRVTFTQQNCPESHSLEAAVSAYNPAPSGSSAPTQMAPTQQPAAVGRNDNQAASGRLGNSSATGTGSSTRGVPCNTGLSERDLRTAKVRGEIVPGMSRKDVESMLGRPNDDAARGAGSSTYWKDKYVAATTVSYDANGCVRSTYQSGHRN